MCRRRTTFLFFQNWFFFFTNSEVKEIFQRVLRAINLKCTNPSWWKWMGELFWALNTFLPGCAWNLSNRIFPLIKILFNLALLATKTPGGLFLSYKLFAESMLQDAFVLFALWMKWKRRQTILTVIGQLIVLEGSPRAKETKNRTFLLWCY